MAKSINRRNFVQGAALSAAALGGMSLVGCTGSSSGAGSADDDAADSASDEEELYGTELTGPEAEPIEPVAVPEEWDYEADIIWVGSGGAGNVGPWKAASDGLSVIVLEKNSSTGGTSQETNIFSVSGTKYQVEQGYDEFDLATALTSQASLQGLGTKMNTPLLSAFLPRVPECADWMYDNGVQWEIESECYGIEGLCWEGSEAGGFEVRASKVTLDYCKEQAESLGVEYKTSTPATALVQDDDGRVVGVQAEDEDGNVIYLKGEKAVVLSAGGMEHNKDLLAKYCPTALKCLTTTANTGNTGDGIRMGLGVGAAMAGYDTFMGFDGGMDWNGTWSHYLYSGDVQLVRQPWLGLNKQGERYPYWSLSDYTGFAATMAGSTLLSQPEGHGYVFWDADFETNIVDFEEYMCRRPITPELADDGADLDRLPESIGPHDYMEGVEKALEAGVIKQADTLEELAELLDFDPDILVAQVEAWNEICEAGVDSLYGYKEKWLKPIQNAPFYGAAVGSTILSTASGLKWNGNMQVVGTDGNVIPGLYTAGCNAGGLAGTTNNGLSGSGVMQSCAGGYVAACYIAENE